MAKATWTRQANLDLEEIVFYLGVEQDRRRTARKIAREIRDKCEVHAISPLLGTARSDLGEGLRVFSHKRWVVVFRPHAEGIEVLRIVDGSRDYNKLLQ